MASTFAENLVRLRKLRGLSQEELAKLAGVSRGSIINYEKESSGSYIENIKAIAVALNVSIDTLLGTPEYDPAKGPPQHVDARSMKKIQTILALPRDKRFMIYTIAEALAAQKQNS